MKWKKKIVLQDIRFVHSNRFVNDLWEVFLKARVAKKEYLINSVSIAAGVICIFVALSCSANDEWLSHLLMLPSRKCEKKFPLLIFLSCRWFFRLYWNYSSGERVVELEYVCWKKQVFESENCTRGGETKKIFLFKKAKVKPQEWLLYVQNNSSRHNNVIVQQKKIVYMKISIFCAFNERQAKWQSLYYVQKYRNIYTLFVLRQIWMIASSSTAN